MAITVTAVILMDTGTISRTTTGTTMGIVEDTIITGRFVGFRLFHR
jgi:hypothetical protein